ncbi:GNAT family N-acetyltransferase [Rheinheimera sp.]|uniref:GNAT family N-acetyltransferase n=1 Tax=Rheinheimera sp. TaxID=1869214 RepID=UPI00307DAA54
MRNWQPHISVMEKLMLTTERLIIRPLTLDDAAFALALYNEPSFLQYIGDKGVRTLADARSNLEQGALASYPKFGFGMYKVVLQDGTAIGLCGLIQRDFLPVPDLGYAYFPQFTGQGYALEAAQAVVAHARTLQLTELQAIVSPQNLASKKLLEKVGMLPIPPVLVPDKNEWVDAYQLIL